LEPPREANLKDLKKYTSHPYLTILHRKLTLRLSAELRAYCCDPNGALKIRSSVPVELTNRSKSKPSFLPVPAAAMFKMTLREKKK